MLTKLFVAALPMLPWMFDWVWLILQWGR